MAGSTPAPMTAIARYQSHCHVCHGPDGLGSSYAPGLIESLARIGYEGYLEAVMYGIENVTQAEQSVMPAFAEVEEVVKHVDDIYSYLKARADGVIGRGRPERLADLRLSRRTLCLGRTSWPLALAPWFWPAPAAP